MEAAKAQDSRKHGRDEDPDAHNYQFELVFHCLSDLKLMLDIIGCVSNEESAMFDIVDERKHEEDTTAFMGIMVCSQTNTGLHFFGRLKCNVTLGTRASIDGKAPQTFFIVPTRRLIAFVKPLDDAYALTMSLDYNCKLHLKAHTPDGTNTGMVERLVLNTVDHNTEDKDGVNYLETMKFNFQVQMQSAKMRDLLMKFQNSDIGDIMIKLEHVTMNASRVTVFSMCGESDSKDAVLHIAKALSVVDDPEGNQDMQVYKQENYTSIAYQPDDPHLPRTEVEAALYSVKPLLDIMKNIRKGQHVNLSFGTFSLLQEGQVEENTVAKPCLVELPLGSETSYLRFLLESKSDGDAI